MHDRIGPAGVLEPPSSLTIFIEVDLPVVLDLNCGELVSQISRGTLPRDRIGAEGLEDSLSNPEGNEVQ